MAVIFWFSSRTADQSNAQSDTYVEFLAFLIKDLKMRILIVRKTAHCTEYAMLSLLLSGAWYFTKEEELPLGAVICTSMYAVSDEIHQLYVAGRSCEVVDWAIDTLGAILGALVFYAIYNKTAEIINRRKKGKNNERIGI